MTEKKNIILYVKVTLYYHQQLRFHFSSAKCALTLQFQFSQGMCKSTVQFPFSPAGNVAIKLPLLPEDGVAADVPALMRSTYKGAILEY